jgi:transposase
VNDVRKQENRELREAGDHVPPRTKCIRAQNPENLPQDRRAQFDLLKETSLKAARAWAPKDAATKFWRYLKRGWAVRAWKLWVVWAMRGRLEPMKRAARTIRDRMRGIVNAIVLGVTSALAESNNAKIQWVKKKACGFRNRERFRNATYFHLGGLDFHPRTASATHTTS